MCRLCLLLFSGVGYILPEEAAARVAAHPASTVKEVVRFPLAPLDRWGLPSIPLNTGRDLPSIRPSTGGGAHCYRCVWCLRVLFFVGDVGVAGVKMDETSTRSAGTGGSAGCFRGGGGSNDAH